MKRTFTYYLGGRFSLVASLLLILMALLPDMACAQQTKKDPSSGLYYYVSNGEATITGYEEVAKDLVIPEKIGDYVVTAIGEKAFKDLSVNTLTIPATIAKIGSEAFCDIDNITSMIIFERKADIEGYSDTMLDNATLTVKVPEGCEELYAERGVKAHFYLRPAFTIKEDGDVVQGVNDIPVGTYEVGDITYIRNIGSPANDGRYRSLFFPFDINLNDDRYQGIFDEVWTFDPNVTLKSDDRFYVRLVKVEGEVATNTPLLVKVKEGVQTISFTNSNPFVRLESIGHKLKEATLTDENGYLDENYRIFFGGTIDVVSPNGFAFSFNTDASFGMHPRKETMNPFRAYIWIMTSSGKPLWYYKFYSNINPGSGTTGIDAVQGDISTPARSAIYGMDGKMVRPAGSSLAGLAKGIYIQNGKKLVVK